MYSCVVLCKLHLRHRKEAANEQPALNTTVMTGVFNQLTITFLGLDSTKEHEWMNFWHVPTAR